MVQPLNNYVQIEPEVTEGFVASVAEKYEEIGRVVALPNQISIDGKRYFSADMSLSVGDRVYFDSWMAAKFPAGEGKFYWLVPFENITAYESSLPKVDVQEELSARLQDTLSAPTGFTGTMPEVRYEGVLSTEDPVMEIHGVSHSAGTSAERPPVSP